MPETAPWDAPAPAGDDTPPAPVHPMVQFQALHRLDLFPVFRVAPVAALALILHALVGAQRALGWRYRLRCTRVGRALGRGGIGWDCSADTAVGMDGGGIGLARAARCLLHG